ncbi:hypothetical protein LJR175_006097 [Variovorax sp. LjRoot175]
MLQQIARQHVEAVQGSTRDAHKHDHQGGRQAMVGAELVPDRRNVRRREFEELIAVEFAQPGRQGFLTDESQGEGRHGWGSTVRSINVPVWRPAGEGDRGLAMRRQPGSRMDIGFPGKAHRFA